MSKLSIDQLIAKHNQRAIPSEHCFFEQVVGESMEPLLRHGDGIVIDPEDIDLIDALYAFDAGYGHHVVYRVSNDFRGNVQLISDNKVYPPQTLTAERARMMCMGRVIRLLKTV